MANDRQDVLQVNRWRRYEAHITGYHETYYLHGRDEAHALHRFREWWPEPSDEIVLRDTGFTVKAT